MSIQRHYTPLTANTAYTNAAARTRVLTRYNMWSKKETGCHLVLYLFLLYKLLNMFRATLYPSSGADDLVVFLSRVV